jgi:site-specific recombinase XerD
MLMFSFGSGATMTWTSSPEQAMKDFLKSQIMPNGKAYTPATVAVYLAMWSSFLEYLAVHRVALTSASAQDLEGFLNSGLGTARTRRRYLSLINQAFFEMVKVQVRNHNPAEGLLRQFREGPRPLPVALDESEEARVRAHLPVSDTWKGLRDRALLLLILDAGLRVGEISSLSLQGTHLEGSPAFVEVLGLSDARLASIAPGSVADLKQWLELRALLEIPGDSVFPATQKGGALSPSAIYRMASSAMAAAGLHKTHQGPHVLRNTFAVRQLRHGRTLNFVRTSIGHQRLTSTEPYRRLVPPDAPV